MSEGFVPASLPTLAPMPTQRTHTMIAVGDGSQLSDAETGAQSGRRENGTTARLFSFHTRMYFKFREFEAHASEVCACASLLLLKL
jgi:hypothetical protein